MADRKFLSSTEALGIGLSSGAAPVEPARSAAPAPGWDPSMIKWIGRIAATLAEQDLPISELVAAMERRAGGDFDFNRFSGAFQALKDTGAVQAMTTPQGVVYALTDTGRELV